MNKPAPKEPSMDEILSSIRQIIADDDASSTPKSPAAIETERAVAAMLDSGASRAAASPAAHEAEPEPLALSAEQILEAPPAQPDTLDFSAFMQDESAEAADDDIPKGQFIDPEDISFDPDPMPEPLPPPRPVPAPVRAVPPPPPVARQPERPRPTPAQAAPMPDPRLSEDMAEQLLEPTTDAAVRANFTRLANFGLGTPGLTIEAMVREMLRPMLKDWLDENLPSVVERMVEKEIVRISRGVEQP